MKFYLMRHAEAEDGEQMDPTRGLTKLGKRQAKMMAKWFDRQAEKPEVVVQSNMKRSQQTAERLSRRLGVDIVTSAAIDPDGEPRNALRALQQIGKKAKAESVVAVSHGPLVEKILAHLTGGSPEQFHFAHAAVAHWGPDNKLKWMVSPNTVARDEDESENVTNDLLEALRQVERLIPLAEAGEYYYDEIEQKRWLLGGGGKSGNCEFCEDMADLGWVDMDDVFPTDSQFGDVDEPPAHDSCTCSVDFRTRRVRVYASDRSLAVIDSALRLLESGRIAA